MSFSAYLKKKLNLSPSWISEFTCASICEGFRRGAQGAFHEREAHSEGNLHCSKILMKSKFTQWPVCLRRGEAGLRGIPGHFWSLRIPRVVRWVLALPHCFKTFGIVTTFLHYLLSPNVDHLSLGKLVDTGVLRLVEGLSIWSLRNSPGDAPGRSREASVRSCRGSGQVFISLCLHCGNLSLAVSEPGRSKGTASHSGCIRHHPQAPGTSRQFFP